ncbi:MAG: hypothetical protein GX130_07560 [Candidatus Hydrogenedens sp.]|jgi:hypothetical protein|nr:hypothetical protein [Candidatus Hydrogenedens sp.]
MFKLFKRLFKGNKPNEVVVFAYPTFVYSWPLILFGYLFAGIQQLGGVEYPGIAWTYIFLVALVMLTLGVDLGRNASVFCLVSFAAVWLGILWLQATKDVMIFAKIGTYIRELQPTISSSMLTSISTILLFIYILMFFLARLNDRWRITNNEIEHRSLGRRDDSYGRGAKRVVAVYPDVLELLICLSGNIEVYTANSSQRLVTIENVPFLPFHMGKINKILETKSVTAAADDDDEEDD